MKRIGIALAALLATAAQPAQAQSPQVLCDNVRKIVTSAIEPSAFGSVLAANGAAALLPSDSFRECRFEADGPRYSCRVPVPQEQMAQVHNALGQILTQCLQAQPEVEQVEPGLFALPYFTFMVGTRVSVGVFPRQDWGVSAEDAWDEEFPDFGFDLVITRLD